MAVLKHQLTGEVQFLTTQHTVGRNPSNLLIIDAIDVSRAHATIFWENQAWYVRDHSRNGTIVNHKYLNQSTLKLQVGDKIQFGNQEPATWELIDSGPPTSFLQSGTKDFFSLATNSITLYPDRDRPLASFYLSKNHRWALDNGNFTEELIHGESYSFDDKSWVFFENTPLDETLDYKSVLEEASLICKLSPDEESVQVKVVVNELELDLGEKVYNHLILLLARRKQQDAERGFAKEEQGWIFIEELLPRLSKELMREIDVYYLNIMIHRLRSHLKDLKPYGYLFSNIIERRRGKLRINHPKIQVYKEGQEPEVLQDL